MLICISPVDNAMQGINNVSNIVDITAGVVLGFIPVVSIASSVISGINSIIHGCTVGCMTVSCSYLKRQLLSMGSNLVVECLILVYSIILPISFQLEGGIYEVRLIPSR